MGLIPVGVGIAEAAAQDLLDLIFVMQRNIGGFVADVTLEEVGVDELEVTDHPVEQGADITDHSFKRPAHLTVRAGWSNSSPQALGDPNYVQSIYDSFLAMQANRQPIEVVTGKRIYENMLINRLQITTDEKTEHSLAMVCEMREIILVATQTVTVGNASKMTNPQLNGAVQNQGAQSLQPGTNYNPAGDS